MKPSIRRPVRTALSTIAVAVLGAGALATVTAPAAHAYAPGNPTKDVIANLFEYNWNSVAAECTNVLGPAGYGGVQVAPPQESVSLGSNSPAHPWWEVYQPMSYQVNSRMGTRAQYAAMVTACHNAGIKVYADAVLNHMDGQGTSAATGYAGTTSTNYRVYSGLYGTQDFHYANSSTECPTAGTILDYNVKQQVQFCDLVGLADLRTESDYVRSTEAAYLNDLISLGTDGFRLDAAKHIPAADIAAIEAKLSKTVYIYQEVIPGGAVPLSDYSGTGDWLEFTYGQKLMAQLNGSVANLKTFGSTWGFQPAAQSVTFVDNHDTDRNSSTLTYKDGTKYDLANVFHLAWGYGTPQVYSSFAFSGNDNSPPANSDGTVTDTECTSGAWTCYDRRTAITGMVGWHNAVSGESVANWWDDGANNIAFSRGSKGFVAINNSSSSLTRAYATGLAAGTYCDVISGVVSNGSCAGTAVTVDSSGNASLTVPANGAVAIDVNSTGTAGASSSTGTVAVTFNATATTVVGQNVYVVGNVVALSDWSTNGGVALSSANYPVWSGTVSLPANTAIEYKYIKRDGSGNATWESGSNRTYTTGSSGATTLTDTWQ